MDFGSIEKTFRACARDVGTMFLATPAGAARRSEFFKPASDIVKSLFSREALMPAKGIPEPSLASVAALNGVVIPGAILLSAIVKSSEKDKNSDYGVSVSLSLMAAVSMLLLHTKPFGLKTGGIAFEGGLGRAALFGGGCYGLAIGLKYLLKKFDLYFLSSSSRDYYRENNEKLTYLLDLKALGDLFLGGKSGLATSAVVGAVSIAGSVLAMSQVLGYASSKVGLGCGIGLTGFASGVIFSLIKGNVTTKTFFGVSSLIMVRNFSIVIWAMSLAYGASGNLFAPVFFAMLKLIDFYVSQDVAKIYPNGR